MKARDIIPGWPRGKSTTQPTVPPLTWWEMHDGGWYEMVEGFSTTDRRYHASQQAVVDAYARERHVAGLWVLLVREALDDENRTDNPAVD